MHFNKVQNVLLGIGSLEQSNVKLKVGEEKAIAEMVFNKIKGKEKRRTVELPYLQVFLDKLYIQITNDQSRNKEALFTLSDLHEIGDIGDILRNFLDEQVLFIAQKFEHQSDDLWRILSQFVSVEGTKEPLTEEDVILCVPEMERQFIQQVLQTLISRRILRYVEHEGLYEIAHDSLAKQINTKRSNEEIATLEVQRLIHSQVSLKLESRDFFTEKQLLLIEQYIDKLNLLPNEIKLIEDSQKHWQDKNANEIKRKERALKDAKIQAKKEKTIPEGIRTCF